MSISRTTRWKRINLYGFTPEEADNCPIGTPIWMYRIEQEEGVSVRDILADTAVTASETGYTLPDLAREWGVNRTTLQHWATRWGIRFPRGVSAFQRDIAASRVREINERKRGGQSWA